MYGMLHKVDSLYTITSIYATGAEHGDFIHITRADILALTGIEATSTYQAQSNSSTAHTGASSCTRRAQY